MGTLMFHSPGYVDEKMVDPLVKMVQVKAADAIIGRLDKPRTGALPRSSGATALTAAAMPQHRPGSQRPFRCPVCGKPAPYLGTYADWTVTPRRLWFACIACGDPAARTAAPENQG